MTKKDTKMYLSVIIFILAATMYMITKLTPIVHDICKKNNFDHHTCHIINKIIRYIISMLGISIVLQNIGIQISMLIAAFGVTGIVLSYGLKDIVANFIASILILGYKHIKINDYIKIKDWEGRVIDINLRYTTLQTNEMTIFIPNIILYTQTVGVSQQHK